MRAVSKERDRQIGDPFIILLVKSRITQQQR